MSRARGDGTFDERSAADRAVRSLREVVLELLSDEPQRTAQLTGRVREEWGPTTRQRVARALRELEREGRARRTAAGWVAADADNHEPDEVL